MLALVGLYFQIWITRKSTDLQALQEFVRNADQREDRLLDAETDPKRDQAFNEFLNFLETSAGALNDNLYPKTTKRFVREKVRDSIATIQGVQIWHSKFEQAITTDTTFTELAKFMRRNRADIDRIVKMRAALATADTGTAPSPS